MKIGIVCYPTHGGSGVVATELGKQLAKRGHEIHFFSYQVPFRLDKYYTNIFFHEVQVPTYPVLKYPPYSFSLVSKIAEVSKKEGLDIIHVHYAVPHSVCGNLARDMLKRETDQAPVVVTTLHGTDITLVGNHPSFFPITKYSMEDSNSLTCVSNKLQHETYDIFGIEQPISTIYNFIDYEEYRPGNNNRQMRKELAPNGEKILLHISNFRAVKRVEDVIQTFAKVQEQVSTKLLMVGDGPDKTKAEQLARELGLEDEIIFMGKQDQIKNILDISDLFILPSERESFGLVALEAMAFRIPVIATQVGGIPEVVSEGETGYLLPVGDIDGMAEKTLKILLDESLSTSLGNNARNRVINKFSVEQVIPQYEQLYQKTLGRV
ncbi:N-acetyl-alpha-D-glucosaminyl L-malate synthase BshA [Natranaerobius thermophilus]|uniref:Glycosyl transferase group 1 n=1 Tax=Natranaerobius thermophilus (strain ATCC BAA-1301 / DSM 18059 / JW/NM-WN-LF) TaxID=457570 RepID=B2A254_NATTJ|nr:N-acetyl-alpha-D-glucosaminyl L-malate synthase BshA [Natranaerobius thermophilus]ACB84859.1 glycosyl transferase group 1 [Natranaerobius thermophilus JW/NM-WN-LF]